MTENGGACGRVARATTARGGISTKRVVGTANGGSRIAFGRISWPRVASICGATGARSSWAAWDCSRVSISGHTLVAAMTHAIANAQTNRIKSLYSAIELSAK